MIFIFGVVFLIAGLISLVFFLRKIRLPKAEAYIQDVCQDYYEKDTHRTKKHPHGKIQYYDKSIEYKAGILLLKRKAETGDKIMVSFKEDHPEKPAMYAPKQELNVFLILVAIGMALMGVSIFAMDYFDLW